MSQSAFHITRTIDYRNNITATTAIITLDLSNKEFVQTECLVVSIVGDREIKMTEKTKA